MGAKLIMSRMKNKHKAHEIWYYNNGRLKKENIVAEKWVRLIYESPVGSSTLPYLVKRKFLSYLYGRYCQTEHSAKKIPQFIEENQIDMTGFGYDPQNPHYKNFTEFFIREKEVLFSDAPATLCSPCEGLATVSTDIDPRKLIAAKGNTFTLKELFDDRALGESYAGGTMLRLRLTPANYHRMHFFDGGKVNSVKFIDGDLFSVSPIALNGIARLYCRNKRAVISFSSVNFGDVTIVEVGATFVGSIVHCFDEPADVRRGQQASYFMPGGSLVMIFFKKDAFAPQTELLEHSGEGYETKVAIGEILGYAPGKQTGGTM